MCCNGSSGAGCIVVVQVAPATRGARGSLLDSCEGRKSLSCMKHDKLIDRLGGYAVLAVKVKRNPSTTFRWWQNASIPPEYWPAVAGIAKRQGLPDVDHCEPCTCLAGRSQACVLDGHGEAAL